MSENIEEVRLDSWKTIAAYLRRDIRTVIRWERKKGLPVHRIPGGQRQAVFAYRSELDAWLTSQDRQTDLELPESSDQSELTAETICQPTEQERALSRVRRPLQL